MRVLIVAASRHGSTKDIADAIADELQQQAIDADSFEAAGAEYIADLEKYDAVVIGSAVYMGRWLPSARQFVLDHSESLRKMPVWLFSSGPIGVDDPKPHGDPEGIREILETSGAREHKVFAGKLDLNQLGFGERLAAKVVHAPEGDFRDWDAVREWGRDITDALSTTIAR